MTRWHLAATAAAVFALALFTAQPAFSQSAHDHQNPPGSAGSAPQPSATRGDMMGSGMDGAMRVRPMVDTADVTEFFKRYLERQRNERLKLGKVADAGTITADIVTVDDSLVETFKVDRVTGQVSSGK